MLCLSALSSSPSARAGGESGQSGPWPPPPDCVQGEEKVQIPIKCCGRGPPPSGSRSGLPKGPGAQAHRAAVSHWRRQDCARHVFRGEGLAMHLHVCLSGTASVSPSLRAESVCVAPATSSPLPGPPSGAHTRKKPCVNVVLVQTWEVGTARHTVPVRSPAMVPAPQVTVFKAPSNRVTARRPGLHSQECEQRRHVFPSTPLHTHTHTRGCRTSITLRGSHSPPPPPPPAQAPSELLSV